jgi:hypothetical protein
MFRVENMGCDGDAGHEEDPRKSKKIAEFNADAMTLNVFRDEKKKRARCVAIFLSSDVLYSKCPGNTKIGPPTLAWGLKRRELKLLSTERQHE